MIPAQIQAIVNREVQLRIEHETPAVLIEGCVRNGERPRDGTGAHLQLRRPWYNDASHAVTDSTIFRILLIVMVGEWVLKKLG